MVQRYRFTLSKELLERAATTLNEPRDDEGRWQAIDELKSRYDDGKYGPLESTDDKFILLFLRSRHFNQAKSLRVLQKYHRMRTKLRPLFELVNNVTRLQAINESGMMWIGEERCSTGEYVFYFKPRPDTHHFTPYEIFAYGQVCMAHLLKNEEAQICGMVTVDDLKFYDHDVTRGVHFRDIKRIISLIQDGTPIQMKPIHYFGEGKSFDLLWALVKPFMKKSLIEQNHLHGMHYNALQETTYRNAVPPCYGGNGVDCSEAHRRWMNNLNLKTM